MQFIDLSAQYRTIKADLDRRIKAVIDSAQFILGSEVGELETCLASYVGVKHCIALSSGTDALLVAMMALGISQGDEVITTSFSFIATASMVKLLGAKPIFVDIDPHTYNIDASLLERAITPRTKAILPVNLYGQCADFDAITTIAKKHGLAVIEDAAQSFGATYKNQQSCSLGDIGCASFFPSKPLGCYGDGGACFTNDDNLAAIMRQVANHGQDRRYHHVRLGINGRLDTLQAAVLLAKLEVFDDEMMRRQQIAEQYSELLAPYVNIPQIAPYNQSIYAQYTIRVDQRELLAKSLQEQGIPTTVHYPMPIHLQPVFVEECSQQIQHSDCSHSDLASRQVLSLPFHPYLQSQDLNAVVAAVKYAVEGKGKLSRHSA